MNHIEDVELCAEVTRKRHGVLHNFHAFFGCPHCDKDIFHGTLHLGFWYHQKGLTLALFDYNINICFPSHICKRLACPRSLSLPDLFVEWREKLSSM